ncbi:hypothetical protein [Xenorhabdus nematophila]|uniref:hypothetical protein n=1 Tax=Xenorhabdus nematophila TaxID=628 RepID=UPI00068E73AF|nr:hypothetical protein [Xenorhabdus nematophila]
MNFKKTEILEAIKIEEMNSFYPLKMGENVKAETFSKLIALVEESTRLFKNEEFIPKSLLREIHLLSVGISCENYRLQNKELEDVASRLMSCFNMLFFASSVDDEKK